MTDVNKEIKNQSAKMSSKDGLSVRLKIARKFAREYELNEDFIAHLVTRRK